MLLVYEDMDKRKILKNQYKDYIFVGTSYFLRGNDDLKEVLNLLLDKQFEHIIVDISNIIEDGNFFKVYIERVLWLLKKYITDVHFCIRENCLDKFMQWFPDFFDDKDINRDYMGGGEVSETRNRKIGIIDYKVPSKIYVYDEIEILKYKKIIPITELIELHEGVFIRYDIDDIKRKIVMKEVEYIDISSLIQVFELRNDIVLQAEMLIYMITAIYGGKFCVRREYLSLLEKKIPYMFTEIVEVKEQVENGQIDDKERDIDINRVADEINSSLIGHDDFKVDFKKNFIKYSLLNSMGERKIFSIIICGESGIGKTEFAKITSKKLYPNEELIKINFGNYSTEGVLNSLIGSPLGYIGSEEGGELINKIEKSKSKVILIDEFEKATASVYNFFYELLEDGIFTDRHGKKHDLNGYMIIFTSNMSQEMYQKHIPDALKSRFDMVYYFVNVPRQEKEIFINKSAEDLIHKLKDNFGVEIHYECIKDELEELVAYDNLRDIKRKIEDIVCQEFFEKRKI